MVRISYHTVNGQIRSAAMQGGFKVQLLRDALGSVVQATNFINAPGLTQRFAPYGTQTVSFPDSGQLGTDIRTGWVGSWGYRRTSLVNAERYIRARHYSSTSGRWTTRDPLWPRGGFDYSTAPLVETDASGLGPQSHTYITSPPFCYCPQVANDNSMYSLDYKKIEAVNVGSPKSLKYNCYLKACRKYCSSRIKIFVADPQECSDVTAAIGYNTVFPSCKPLSSEWDVCGKFYTVPPPAGKTNGFNGAFANRSNYPGSKDQCPGLGFFADSLKDCGWFMCQVECKMRVCCSKYSTAEVKRQGDFANCAIRHKGVNQRQRRVNSK